MILYRYTFTTHFFVGNKEPHKFQIVAANDLHAMKAYCRNETVQDMNMDHIEKLVITHIQWNIQWDGKTS